MADSKIADLTNNAAPASTLIVYLTDADGTLDYKATLVNLAASAAWSGLYATAAALAAEATLARNADNLTSGTVADERIASTIARDSEVTAAVAAEATLARNADNLTSGTVADERIPSTIARDSEVAAGYQPLDADLTALAAAGNSAVLAATTASFLTADETKLDGIEAGADVTDATNVAAAGAVMEADTSTASMSFVIDEDTMASDSATKVPTQQSTKAYVDTEIADLPEAGTGLTEAAGFLNVNAIDIQTFTADGTWTKPDGISKVLAVLIGGGGGGASGSRNTEGNNRYGGGGGEAGGVAWVWLDADDLDATEAVDVGTGGTGGAGVSTNILGLDGSAGGDTILDTIAGDVRARGGSGASHVAGLAPGRGAGNNGPGHGGSAVLVAANIWELLAPAGFPGGGGAGASRTSANVTVSGGHGGSTAAGVGGIFGNPGANGVAGSNGLPGSGGGGGSAAGPAGAWAGGDGAAPGGGGGGGSFGNGSTPTNSGAGGDGARGEAWIISFR